jgi:hypothetical protein
MRTRTIVRRIRPELAVAVEIEALLTRSPGLTEAEIAAALFGDTGYPARIAGVSRSLIKSRRI